MLFATVPAAPPTRKNQRTTSWPAPISAKVPYQRGSRLIRSALLCVSKVPSFIEEAECGGSGAAFARFVRAHGCRSAGKSGERRRFFIGRAPIFFRANQ